MVALARFEKRNVISTIATPAYRINIVVFFDNTEGVTVVFEVSDAACTKTSVSINAKHITFTH